MAALRAGAALRGMAAQWAMAAAAFGIFLGLEIANFNVFLCFAHITSFFLL
jgi:hypothetical protein